MGYRSLDEAQEDHGSVILRSREEKFWNPNMHRCFGNNCTGHDQGHYTRIRLLSKPQIDNWTRNQRLGSFRACRHADTCRLTRKAVECGAITALAVSADHTTIVGGHANGHIFTWELAKPSSPFLKIPPLAPYQMEDRKEDGHVEGVSVLHLGFLGTRHTALVSADDKGMAFSHLATRGLGAVGRTVKTARILGRYPVDTVPTSRPRKPSSVLGLSVLPLGNSPERTDSMGLVAMLTPYLLVIVSTTPIAQTQHKAVRPKETANESALSGCLAWYPAVKLKHTPSGSSNKPASSKARLAYAWSNVLTLLELSTPEAEGPEDPNRPPTLEFHVQSRYKCEEAIVAVQWFSRQVHYP